MQAGVFKMADHRVSRCADTAPQSEEDDDAGAAVSAITSTGKLYTWQLPQSENPELLALPPRALIERVFTRAETFKEVLIRTAAYFIVVSRNNGYEGRDPALITEDLRCGAVADFLGIEIDLLARALLEMQRRELVASCDDGALRLRNLTGLDDLSEGLAAPA